MGGNHIRMMVIGGAALRRIAKKLENNALMYLELHPAVKRNMGGHRDEHYERNNNL